MKRNIFIEQIPYIYNYRDVPYPLKEANIGNGTLIYVL
jgi:hypothetical protein